MCKISQCLVLIFEPETRYNDDSGDVQTTLCVLIWCRPINRYTKILWHCLFLFFWTLLYGKISPFLTFYTFKQTLIFKRSSGMFLFLWKKKYLKVRWSFEREEISSTRNKSKLILNFSISPRTIFMVEYLRSVFICCVSLTHLSLSLSLSLPF
jgi:hypothetical protein